MECLVENLSQLVDCLRAKSRGEKGGPAVPSGLDAGLSDACAALHGELAALHPPVTKAGNKAVSEAGVRRSVWRALTALQGQLELAHQKKAEFEAMQVATANGHWYMGETS